MFRSVRSVRLAGACVMCHGGVGDGPLSPLPYPPAPREEQEKLNVWVALLNLENLYGSEESLRAAFDRALQFCEPLPVYQQLADIYAQSRKHKVSRLRPLRPPPHPAPAPPPPQG